MQLPDSSLDSRRKKKFDQRLQTDYQRLVNSLSEIGGPALPSEPSLDTLWKISCEHGIDLDLFLKGQWDIDLFIKQKKDHPQALPDRYTVPNQMRSRGRTIRTILSAVQTHLSSTYVEQILRRLQVPRSYEFNVDEYISQNLVVDILSEVKRIGLEDHGFRILGLHSAAINKNSSLGQNLKDIKSGKEVYRAIHQEYLHFFDKNWNYIIQKLDSNSIDARITLRDETIEAFKSYAVGSRETCLVRQGTYASMLSLSLGKPARISESRCMHVEGDHCLYHLNWD